MATLAPATPLPAQHPDSFTLAAVAILASPCPDAALESVRRYFRTDPQGWMSLRGAVAVLEASRP